ncbi:hypothetical protein CerSpe_248800 [Prunus speciosa]
MKKALGLKSLGLLSKKSLGSGGSRSRLGNPKRVMTVGELMRIQMGICDAMDSRVRRALLRISAAQVGRRIESVVVPLEKLKSSDFTDQQEYDACKMK